MPSLIKCFIPNHFVTNPINVHVRNFYSCVVRLPAVPPACAAAAAPAVCFPVLVRGAPVHRASLACDVSPRFAFVTPVDTLLVSIVPADIIKPLFCIKSRRVYFYVLLVCVTCITHCVSGKCTLKHLVQKSTYSFQFLGSGSLITKTVHEAWRVRVLQVRQ